MIRTINGRAMVNALGKVLADLCACLCAPSVTPTVPLPCCDSFAVCCDETTPIKKILFATVVVRQGPGPGGTILSTFSIPIRYRTTIDFGGLTRTGWYGCEARDIDTDCFAVAVVFLQCTSSEFRISFNGFIPVGHVLCDSYVAATGQGAAGSADGTFGTLDLICTPFSISSTGNDFTRDSDTCGAVYIEMAISE